MKIVIKRQNYYYRLWFYNPNTETNFRVEKKRLIEDGSQMREFQSEINLFFFPF